MPGILVTSGERLGAWFPLANRPLSAGRDPSRDIQILDPKVSRKHFMIRKRDDVFVLVPFHSLNGVVINGVDIQCELELRDGDEIVVGDTSLRFMLDDDPDRANALEKYKVADRRVREDRTIRGEDQV